MLVTVWLLGSYELAWARMRAREKIVGLLMIMWPHVCPHGNYQGLRLLICNFPHHGNSRIIEPNITNNFQHFLLPQEQPPSGMLVFVLASMPAHANMGSCPNQRNPCGKQSPTQPPFRGRRKSEHNEKRDEKWQMHTIYRFHVCNQTLNMRQIFKLLTLIFSNLSTVAGILQL